MSNYGSSNDEDHYDCDQKFVNLAVGIGLSNLTDEEATEADEEQL